MGLPLLFAQPTDQDSWTSWAWNHAANHGDWNFAIQQQKSQNLPEYLLSPLDPNNLGMWLYLHQSAHNAVNAALGTQGYDLLSLDWKDEDQFAEWLNQNGEEHQRISAALGVG